MDFDASRMLKFHPYICTNLFVFIVNFRAVSM